MTDRRGYRCFIRHRFVRRRSFVTSLQVAACFCRSAARHRGSSSWIVIADRYRGSSLLCYLGRRCTKHNLGRCISHCSERCIGFRPPLTLALYCPRLRRYLGRPLGVVTGVVTGAVSGAVSRSTFVTISAFACYSSAFRSLLLCDISSGWLRAIVRDAAAVLFRADVVSGFLAIARRSLWLYRHRVAQISTFPKL